MTRQALLNMDPEQRRIAETAERYGMPYVCMDDRPNPSREALRVQARSWGDELWRAGFAVVKTDETGVQVRIPGLGIRLFSVGSLRDLIRMNGGLHEKSNEFRVLLAQTALQCDRDQVRSPRGRGCFRCGIDHVAGLCPGRF